jgi:hypothetical protein
MSDPHEGDRVWFAGEKLPYNVQAVSETGRYVACTKPFAARHTYLYTVVDHEERIRGADNSLGRCLGYETPEECRDALAQFESGAFEFSRRVGPIPLDLVRVQHNGNSPACRADLSEYAAKS